LADMSASTEPYLNPQRDTAGKLTLD
jgi:hypothetical protein